MALYVPSLRPSVRWLQRVLGTAGMFGFAWLEFVLSSARRTKKLSFALCASMVVWLCMVVIQNLRARSPFGLRCLCGARVTLTRIARRGLA